MPVIHVHSNLRDYDAVLDSTLHFKDELSALTNKVFVVDQNVWNLYGKSALNWLDPQETILFEVNEDKKNLTSVQEIVDRLLEKSAKRNLTLVTIGGGILQDITGFVASTLYRGINWLFFPTTLLAQADSCIGSKTSLNYKGYKNLMGTFYPPSRVFIDVDYLATLKEADFYSGLGEAVKLSMMGGRQKVDRLVKIFPQVCSREKEYLQEIIRTSLEVKLDFISNDEFDLGRRNMLNFGHCFGHAIESVSNFAIPHGQAVVCGMILANFIANRRGILSDDHLSYYEKELLVPSLKVRPGRSQMAVPDIIRAMEKDKKRTGSDLALVMMTDRDGELVRVNDLSREEVGQAVEYYLTQKVV